MLGHGDPGAMFPEASGSPRLIAVVMRMEHPIDLAHADFFEAVDDGARPGVDEDAAVTGGDAVDIAGVGPAKDSRGDLGPRHGRVTLIFGVGGRVRDRGVERKERGERS